MDDEPLHDHRPDSSPLYTKGHKMGMSFSIEDFRFEGNEPRFLLLFSTNLCAIAPEMIPSPAELTMNFELVQKSSSVPFEVCADTVEIRFSKGCLHPLTMGGKKECTLYEDFPACLPNPA